MRVRSVRGQNYANRMLWAGLPPYTNLSNTNSKMYVKNESLADLLDNINSAIYVEQQETKRGEGEGEDYMRRLRKQQHQLRELEIAWMTLQDMVELDARYKEGSVGLSYADKEWQGMIERSRELFQSSEAAFTNGSDGSKDVRG